MIKLLILDIDGVLTNGRKIYNLDGDCVYKEYCDRDFTAIKKFKAIGINVCFLSGDAAVNEKMAELRKVDFYLSRDKKSNLISKASFIPVFEETYNCKSTDMIYVGDDIFDLDIIKKVKYSYCPAGSDLHVLKNVNKVLSAKSGDHVVQCLFETMMQDGLIEDADEDKIKILDSQERVKYA